jgi:methionyl-tRNA formyltransferase
MSLIQWNQPARSIAALLRALDPWPGAYTSLEDKELKLFSPKVLHEDRSQLEPGRIARRTETGIEVETGQGLIRIGELQMPGKKRLSASEFLRGFAVTEGTILGR